MSWWTKNRKYAGAAAGLLALPFVGPAAMAGVKGLLGGLGATGLGGAGAAGAGATAAGAGATELAGAGVAKATMDVGAAEAAREAAMAGLSQIPQGLGNAVPFGNTGYSVGGALSKATGGILGDGAGLTPQNASLAMMGLNMMQPQQQQSYSPPPPPAPAPMPQSNFGGYQAQGGVDDEQMRRLLAMLQQRGMMR